jgi:GntR family transcriptional regulator/MocR family aminotransferase
MDPGSLVLDLDGRGPRYAQIARALIGLIHRGVLAPGRRAPSTRALAAGLACARNIVLLAYEQLLLEGYLVSRRRAGTFVAPHLPRGDTGRTAGRSSGSTIRARSTLSPAGRRVVEAAAAARGVTRRQGCSIDFMFGLAEPDDRLIGHLRRALSRPLRDRAFSYGPPAGDGALREQIARRLEAARGISRPPDHVVLTSGAQQALDICARLLVGAGDRVVVEDPGYEAAKAAFVAAGARIIPVRVDRDGLDPARLPAGRRAIRLVYVTPSHQFPTGAVMPAARRYALLAWARRHHAYVLEDDYDGEFRHAGQSIPALAALDTGSVIYCGTFAKSLFPALRLGYLVLPPALVDPAVHARWVTDRGGSRLVERAVADLLETGEYDRHVRRMQRRYSERRHALIRALEERFGSAVEIAGHRTGLHLVVWLPALAPHRVGALVAASRARGVAVYPVAPYAVRPIDRAGLLLGYGLVGVDAIARGIEALADAYQETIDNRPTGGGERTVRSR